MMGTAAATLPTSSSVCIIFLMRPWKEEKGLGNFQSKQDISG